VLNRGRIQQVDVPEAIYERPATRFVADFIGRNNVLDATVRSVSDHSALVQFADGSELTIDRQPPGIELRPGTRVGVCLRAESLRIAGEDGIFAGRVTDV